MAADPEDQVIDLELEDTPSPPPPPPALKKRATKRGLSKLNSALPEDPPEIEMHVTNVYSNCVQRTSFLKHKLLRKPLFSKQSDNTDTDVTLIDDPEPDRPQRKCKTHGTSTTLEEPGSPVIEDEDNLDEDENSEQMVEDVSIVRSPSPPVPPPPPSRLCPKRKRVSKGIQNAFKAINSIKGELKKGVASPQTPTVVNVDSPEQSETQLVRVRHMDDIHRFSMSKTEKFSSLQTQMATLLEVSVDQIGLYLNDSRLELSDTPTSKRLHLADIIVCHILVNKEEGGEVEGETTRTDGIRVQLQCRNSRQKSSMVINKFLPLKAMMERIAEQHGRPLEKFQFRFDGEQLLPNMLPSDVDLDDDDTIDVVELN